MPKDPLNTSELKDLPPIPGGLIEALERRFPSRCPQVTESEREIFFYAGQVALIQWMKTTQLQRQNKAITAITAIKDNITNV